MGQSLNVLIIDDSERDSKLLARALVKAGYKPEYKRVDDVDSLRKTISEGNWDLVLCDSRMPTLSPEVALSVWQKGGGDAPFIMVSGAIDDEEAVAILKAGAQDFIRKDKLARLGPAIDRELREQAQRKKRRRAEEALRESEDRYARLFKAAEVAIWEVDFSGLICSLEKLYETGVSELRLYMSDHPAVLQDLITTIKINDANDSALKMVGAHSTGHLQESILLIFGNGSCNVVIDIFCAIRDGAEAFRDETQLNRMDGKPLSVILSLPIPRLGDYFDSVPISILDITERKKAEQRLRESEARMNYLAYHDALTDLPNRLLFQDRLQHSMSKAHRSGEQLALLFLDLDRFKTINDSLGHDVGDAVLRVVSNRLLDCTRHSDTVARFGGDEFVVILERFKDIKEVILVARKILEILAVSLVIKEHELSFTSSIGISMYPNDSENVEGLMRCADMAMYRAKEKGRNNYQFYTPEMSRKAVQLLTLERELRKALLKNELIVHYQPQLEMATHRLIGMEALVRWQHPEQGIIAPAGFVPLAEETGLIVPIGEWVMRTACAQNKAWQEAGYPPFRIAVNLSGRQFDQKDLVGTVGRILAESGLEPKYLELELTESLVMDDADAAIIALEELNGMGVALAIDDFGTGYSSLSYLKRFPIDKIKIDRSFVQDCTTDENDAAIIASIIGLAHGMGFEVIAEGVETLDQLRFLRQRGADAAQGYFYSPPVSAEELEEFLKSVLS